MEKHCGASHLLRRDFVCNLSGKNPPYEYRFCGNLGFGGKYWIERNKVSCYGEHETPERLAAMEKTNQELEKLAAEYKSSNG